MSKTLARLVSRAAVAAVVVLSAQVVQAQQDEGAAKPQTEETRSDLESRIDRFVKEYESKEKITIKKSKLKKRAKVYSDHPYMGKDGRKVTDTSALVTAIVANDDAAVRAAIQAGADVNEATADKSYPIILASIYGTVDTMKLLTADDADVNAVDSFGRNGVHYAAIEGDIKKVVLLTTFGASARLPDNNGLTPLFYAYLNNQIEMANFLVDEMKESVNRQDKDGELLAYTVAQYNDNPDVYEHMLKHNLNLFRRSKDGLNLIQITEKAENMVAYGILKKEYEKQIEEFIARQERLKEGNKNADDEGDRPKPPGTNE